MANRQEQLSIPICRPSQDRLSPRSYVSSEPPLGAHKLPRNGRLARIRCAGRHVRLSGQVILAQPWDAASAETFRRFFQIDRSRQRSPQRAMTNDRLLIQVCCRSYPIELPRRLISGLRHSARMSALCVNVAARRVRKTQRARRRHVGAALAEKSGRTTTAPCRRAIRRRRGIPAGSPADRETRRAYGWSPASPRRG